MYHGWSVTVLRTGFRTVSSKTCTTTDGYTTTVSQLCLFFFQMEQSPLQHTMYQGVSMTAPLQNGGTFMKNYEEYINVLEENVLWILHSVRSGMTFWSSRPRQIQIWMTPIILSLTKMPQPCRMGNAIYAFIISTFERQDYI